MAMTGLIDRVRAPIQHEALEEWHLAPQTATMLFVLPFVGALIIALLVVDRSLYRFITAEDGLLEWLQFAGDVTASLTGLMIARRLWRIQQPIPALLYLAFGLACFFIAGEEIAWGQRIFDLQTPATLKTVNMQGEITVHNIASLQTKFNVVMLLIGLYGSVGAWLIRRQGWLRRDLVNLFVPPLFLSSAFLILFGYKFMRFAFFPAPRFTVVRYGELSELCLTFGLAAFALLSLQRLRRLESAPAEQPAADELVEAPVPGKGK